MEAEDFFSTKPQLTMTDNKAENGAPDSTVEHMAEEMDMPEFEETGETVSDDDERLQQLEAENADLKDKYLRLMADMENLRRRTAKEVKDANVYGVTNFARDMLAVGDNLGRALQALPDDMADSADDAVKTLLEGVEMTQREMLNALGKYGVTKLEPEGEKFDPNFHQAMFEVPNPDLPSGTVVQVMQAGYVIGERVLRPAMVGVAKGGPRPPKTTTTTDGISLATSAADMPMDSAEDSDQSTPDSEETSGIHVNKTA